MAESSGETKFHPMIDTYFGGEGVVHSEQLKGFIGVIEDRIEDYGGKTTPAIEHGLETVRNMRESLPEDASRTRLHFCVQSLDFQLKNNLVNALPDPARYAESLN